MKREHAFDAAQSHSAGYSLIEALIVVVIGMVIMATAMPYTLEAYRTYELNNAMTQVASVVKFTRMEAIRQNRPVNFNTTQLANGSVQAWTDAARNNVLQPSDNQTLLQSSGDVVAIGGVPNTGAIAASLGWPNGSTGVPPAGGQITFDQRGAVVFPPGGQTLFVICLANTKTNQPGYRAVILLPSGAVQEWSADSGGNWHRIS